VVTTRRKLYDVTALETDDAVVNKSEADIRELETLLSKRTKDKDTEVSDYSSIYNRVQEIMTPIELPLNKPACLTTASVMTNIESIVDNLEEFYSSVYTNGNIKRQKYVIQRYNLGLPK